MCRKLLLLISFLMALGSVATAANLEDNAGVTFETVPGDSQPADWAIDNNNSNEWISDLGVGLGGAASWAIVWTSSVSILRVDVRWNFYPPVSYQIETWNGSTWDVHDVISTMPAANSSVVHQNGSMSGSNFPAGTTKLRINITQSNASNYPRIAEVSIYDVPPAAPTRQQRYTLNNGTASFNFHFMNQKNPFVDLNGDGLIDIVAPNAAGGAIFHQRNDVVRFVSTPDQILTDGSNSPNVTGFGIGEFGTADGRADVAFYEGYAAENSWDIYRNLDNASTPTLSASYVPKTGALYSYWATVADVNNDGRLDLINDFHSAASSNVYILYQQADGSFDPVNGLTVLAGDGNEGGVTAVNVDADPELEIVNASLNVIHWWDNNGTWPTNGTPVTAPTGTYLLDNGLSGNKQDAEVVDINNDGTKDLIVTGGTGVTMWTTAANLWTTGTNVVHDVDVSLGTSIYGCTTGNIDGVNGPDLVVGTGSNSVKGFYNTGTGFNFSTPDLFFETTGIASVGDVVLQDVVENDGILDLIAFQDNNGKVAIFPNANNPADVPVELSTFVIE